MAGKIPEDVRQTASTPNADTVEIWHNGLMIDTAAVTGTSWTYVLKNLQGVVHTLEARRGETVRSNTWSFGLVIEPPLVFDPSPMSLNGLTIKDLPWARSGVDSAGNTAIRTASGGSPPYQYSSSNAAVASVTSSGKVTGESNGNATITARDAAGKTASFSVSVSNIWRRVTHNGPLTSAQAMTWIRAQGGNPVYSHVGDIWINMEQLYYHPFTGIDSWTCPSVLVPNAYIGFYQERQQLVQFAAGDPSGKGAWAFVPK